MVQMNELILRNVNVVTTKMEKVTVPWQLLLVIFFNIDETYFINYYQNQIKGVENCHTDNRFCHIDAEKSLEQTYYNPEKIHLFHDAVPCAKKVLGSKFITASSFLMLIVALLI
jgi:hypothetical protein